jgi:hypothetical protein
MMLAQVRAELGVKPGEPSNEAGPQHNPKDRPSIAGLLRSRMATW